MATRYPRATVAVQPCLNHNDVFFVMHALRRRLGTDGRVVCVPWLAICSLALSHDSLTSQLLHGQSYQVEGRESGANVTQLLMQMMRSKRHRGGELLYNERRCIGAGYINAYGDGMETRCT